MNNLIKREENGRYKINIDELIRCEEVTKVTLTKNGSLLVFTEEGRVIDLGSLRSCGGEFLEIRDLYKLLELTETNKISYETNN